MSYVDYHYPLTERRLRARKRALVVDGDVLSSIDMRLLLEMQGYQVDEVLDGLEAIGLLDLDPPALDLVVLDYEMPLLSGLETLYALRALMPGLKALLCVAPGADVPTRALPERAAYLKKPCMPEDLLDGLGKAYWSTRHNLEHGRVAGSHRVMISGHLPHYPPR